MICSNCEVDKVPDEFHWRIKAKGLRQPKCKECANEYARKNRVNYPERIKRMHERYYNTKRAQVLEQKKDYYRRNRNKLLEHYRNRYQKRRVDPKFKEKIRYQILKGKYGITADEYQRMLSEQGGVCAICRQKGNRKHLAVDHCHKTGKVRGLVCSPCNGFLGRINDDIEILEAIKRYLGKS